MQEQEIVLSVVIFLVMVLHWFFVRDSKDQELDEQINIRKKISLQS